MKSTMTFTHHSQPLSATTVLSAYLSYSPRCQSECARYNFPIILAAQFEDPERLRLLLGAGADVNKTHDSRTVLMEACERNLMKHVKMLLERSADVNVVDLRGNSAMDIAASKGHDEILMLLLDAMA